jgi:predicted regulator of Ras-like GTPase activity (Roadblock/LC7/MglB family)
MDVAPQEERMVSAHLESCESCAKFHHQLQQVIMAAEEVPLPDEMAPNPPEALARNIMEGLPQPKASPFEFIFKMFAKKAKEPVSDRNSDRNASKFPHVNRLQSGDGMDMPRKEMAMPTGKGQGDDHSGTSNRLRAIAKGAAYEGREAQSTTRSLGEKLGFAAPAGSLTDDQPLTLAESIRRKISETKPPGQGDDDEEMAPLAPPEPVSAGDDSWGRPASSPNRPPANMASPPNLTGAKPQVPLPQASPAEPGQTVLGSWGKPSPIDNSNSWGGQANVPAPAAAGISKDDWNFDAAANPAQPMAAQAPGGIDPFAAPAQASSNPNIQQPNPATDSWGGWNDSAPKGAGAASAEAPDSDWGPPPQGGTWDEPAAGAAVSSNSWGGAQTNPAQSTAAAAPKAFMETGMIKLGELGLPSMQQPPSPVAQPMQQQQQPQPPQNPGFPQQQQVGTGSDTSVPALSNSWGGAAQSPSAAPAGAADPWGSASTDSWGASPEQRTWGPQTSSTENSVPAAAAQWGQPAAPQENFDGKPAADWASAAEPASAQESWGGAPSQGSWSQPPVPTSWEQTGSDAGAQPAWGEGNDWAQGGQPPAPQAIPEQQGSSSQAAALGKGRQQAWSLEAEQVETGTWRAFAPSGESLSGAAAPGRAPEPASPVVAKETQSFAPQDEQSRWDIPIQERMKQGQTGTQSGTQIPVPPMPVAPPSPFSQPTFAQAAAAAAPMAPPPSPKPPEPMALPDSPAPTKSGWNFPVYEAPDQLTHIPNEPKVSGAWDSPATVTPPAPPMPAPSMGLSGAWGEPSTPVAQPQPSAPEPKVSGAWDMPSTPSFGQPRPQPMQMASPQANPAQQGLSLPVDSIMDRLGTVLSNNAEGGAQSAQAAAQVQSPWDVSIQERQQQQQQSPWGQVPEPAAPPPMPGNGTGWNARPVAQPAPLQAVQVPAQAPAPALAPVSGNPWDSIPVGPGPSPFALPQPTIPSAWDNPNPMASPAPAPMSVAQPASVAAAPGPAAAPGLFQNLDDNAIDRLFSENLGVNDAGAGPGPASQFPGQRAAQQTASKPSFTAPRWNPGENGGSTGAAPSFTNVSSGAPVAPSQPFSALPAQQQPAADAGTPRISAITPRATAPAEAPATMPGPDRRNTPFGMPAPAPAPIEPMAPSQPPSSPFATPQPVSESAKANGLFDLDDSAMDELFSKNLGVNEAATPLPNSPAQPQPTAPVFQSPPVMAQPPVQPAMPPANPFSRPAPQMPPSMPNPFAPLTAPPAQPPAAAPAQQPAWGQQPPAPPLAPQQQQPGQPGSGGLFSLDDSMIDKIFADNAPPQPPAAPQFNVNEAVKQFAEVVPMPPPKIAGVGRLDPRVDTTADSGSGRIASIGKFLLDQKDLEKIGKLTASDLSETKMRILTMEAAQELQTLLHHIGTQETVVGSVIVGHDGLLIANTMPPDIDAESIGVWALGVYMSTEMVIKKMGQDRVHQIVCRTPKGYVIIADFGGGLLVTVSDGKDTDTLIPLMRSITQLVRDGEN